MPLKEHQMMRPLKPPLILEVYVPWEGVVIGVLMTQVESLDSPA
jgi:hypothetical protein